MVLYQEDIIRYFEELSFRLKKEGIPILNNLHTYYPRFISIDDVIDDDDETSSEDEYY